MGSLEVNFESCIEAQHSLPLRASATMPGGSTLNDLSPRNYFARGSLKAATRGDREDHYHRRSGVATSIANPTVCAGRIPDHNCERAVSR